MNCYGTLLSLCYNYIKSNIHSISILFLNKKKSLGSCYHSTNDKTKYVMLLVQHKSNPYSIGAHKGYFLYCFPNNFFFSSFDDKTFAFLLAPNLIYHVIININWLNCITFKITWADSNAHKQYVDDQNVKSYKSKIFVVI